MAMTCPRNEIRVRGGKLIIEGDFRMECQGRKCLDFPCKDYDEHRKRSGPYEE